MNQTYCKQIISLLSFYIDNEPIPEEDRRLLDTHLAQCEECRHQFQQLQQINDTIKTSVDSLLKKHVSTDELGDLLDNQIESEFKKIQIEAHLQKCGACHETYIKLKQLNELQPIFKINIRSEKRIYLWLNWLKQFKEKFRAITPNVRILVPVAISILLIVVGYGLFERWSTPASLSDLAEVSPYPYYDIRFRDQLSPSEKQWKDAMNDYIKKDYPVAIEKLRRVIVDDPSNTRARFYLGVCYFIENRLDEAEQQFLQVIKDEPSKERNYWYLSQVYLRKEDRHNALKTLTKVVELQQDKYSAKASKLIGKINRLN